MDLFSVRDLQLFPQSKLVLVEGINGSGKSTYVREFIDANSRYAPMRTYRGRSFHPVDLSRIARFSPKEYLSFCDLCSKETSIPAIDMQQFISSQARYCDGYYWINYTRIAEIAKNQHILSVAHSHEIYDGYAEASDYMKCHLSLWRDFPNKVSTECDRYIHVFEGVALQYPIMNLLGFSDMKLDEISNYLNSILSAVHSLSPCLIYVDVPDVSVTIKRAASERPHWMDNFGSWLSHTLFAKNTGASGEKGVIEFCKKRQEVERYVLERVPVPVRIIQRHDLI